MSKNTNMISLAFHLAGGARDVAKEVSKVKDKPAELEAARADFMVGYVCRYFAKATDTDPTETSLAAAQKVIEKATKVRTDKEKQAFGAAYTQWSRVKALAGIVGKKRAASGAKTPKAEGATPTQSAPTYAGSFQLITEFAHDDKVSPLSGTERAALDRLLAKLKAAIDLKPSE
jgi:hypothetical protein